MPDQTTSELRPVLRTARLFSFCACLCVALVPLFEQDDWIPFLAAGLAYGLLISFVGVGLALALPDRTTWRRLIAAGVLLLAGAGLCLWGPDSHLRMSLDSPLSVVLLSIIGVWASSSCILAGIAWVRYFQLKRAGTDADPPDDSGLVARNDRTTPLNPKGTHGSSQ